MHILIAPNAFKNSLTAADAARCIQEGLLDSRLTCTYKCFPVGDGGDGTGALLTEKLGGRFITGIFHDALGRPVSASYGFLDKEKTAVIEMAATAGMRLLRQQELNPMVATSAGTGKMVLHALDQGAEKIIITLGGSATVDGAFGMLGTFGVRFFDANGRGLSAVPGSLLKAATIDVSNLDARFHRVPVEVWCDVANTLLGLGGAAAVFGPQKGAGPLQVKELDEWLARMAACTLHTTGVDVSSLPSGGAAGGAAAFLHAFIGADMVNGIDRFLMMTEFEQALIRSDLVITGEGAIDSQTLQGKAPYGVAKMAAKHDIPVLAFAGSVQLQKNSVPDKVFDALFAIGNGPLTLEESIAQTAIHLRRTACETGNLLAAAGNIFRKEKR